MALLTNLITPEIPHLRKHPILPWRTPIVLVTQETWRILISPNLLVFINIEDRLAVWDPTLPPRVELERLRDREDHFLIQTSSTFPNCPCLPLVRLHLLIHLDNRVIVVITLRTSLTHSAGRRATIRTGQ